MLNKVTITGADESIHPHELVQLSMEFPFVEWGILLSRKSMGGKRFPSMHWMQLLLKEKENYTGTLSLSGHLCGAAVREVCLGKSFFQEEIKPVWDMFERIQINTHGEPHEFNDGLLSILSINRKKWFIFQRDNVNNAMFEMAQKAGTNCSVLFDLSHGAGVLPDTWPNMLPDTYCGYAGGLSPENLEYELRKMTGIPGWRENNVWIDCETHVRSNGDKLFDMGKVRKFLQIAQKYT